MAERGIFERPKGSKVWWISFCDHHGKRHRERVGAKDAARKMYDRRKAEVRARTYEPSRRSAGVGVSLGDLLDDVLTFVADEKHKSEKDYHIKAGIVREALGDREAASITPLEFDAWLKGRKTSAATANRYRSFLSLAYREGIANGKVSVNPIKSVRHRKEADGRQRFLSREEYKAMLAAITELHPDCAAEFIVAIHTGMRAGEQYSMTWRQVHVDRRTVELTATKNDRPRTVHLNQAAFDAIESVRPEKYKPSDAVFTRDVKTVDNRWWFNPCLEAAGVSPDEFTWHGCRHTFCSWLAMAGASTREIMEAAGHRSLQMAARYAHLSPAHTASVVNRLDDL
jgi:integrase